jgi:hypothetical protein
MGGGEVITVVEAVETVADPLLTTGECAYTLRRSVVTVRLMIERGEIECERDSTGRRLVRASVLRRFIEERDRAKAGSR